MLPIVVPGSLSNLGPGFDVLGMAVGVYNQFMVAPAGEPGTGLEGGWPVEDPASHAFFAAVAAAEARFGHRLTHGISLLQQERVPRSRGLGSSSTARVAGVVAWCHYARQRPPMAELLAVLTELEGHPDNVVAAMLGGLTIAGGAEANGAWRRLDPVSGLRVVLVVPERTVATADARAALPEQYSRADVVFNLRRLGFLLHGLTTGDREALRTGMADRIHQPYRAPLVGPLDAVIAEAVGAGADAAFLSGSGSTIAALVVDPDVDAASVGRAMERPLREAGLKRSVLVTAPAPFGAWELYVGSQPAL